MIESYGAWRGKKEIHGPLVQGIIRKLVF